MTYMTGEDMLQGQWKYVLGVKTNCSVKAHIEIMVKVILDIKCLVFFIRFLVLRISYKL